MMMECVHIVAAGPKLGAKCWQLAPPAHDICMPATSALSVGVGWPRWASIRRSSLIGFPHTEP